VNSASSRSYERGYGPVGSRPIGSGMGGLPRITSAGNLEDIGPLLGYCPGVY
jgi:hypothetical protein